MRIRKERGKIDDGKRQGEFKIGGHRDEQMRSKDGENEGFKNKKNKEKMADIFHHPCSYTYY